MGKYSASPKRKKRWPWVGLILAAILIIGCAGFLLPGALGKNVPTGVQIGGLDLGGMTKKEAAAAIRDHFAGQQIELLLPEQTLRLSQEEMGLRLDSGAAAADAVNSQGGELSLGAYWNYGEGSLRRILENVAADLANRVTHSHYEVEGLPQSLEETQEDLPAPVLVVTLGAAGYTMDIDGAEEMIYAALGQGEFRIDLTGALSAQGGEILHADEILEAVQIAPVDARMENGTAIPGTLGVSFPREALESALDSATPGETIRIEGSFVQPEISGQEVYFQDVLGFGQTPHNDSEKRNTNLTLACQALNGVVLQPGETLSYNATVGQRTEEAGYQKAPAYSGTELVDSLGGGVCQVSSTLYLASLYAELETVERVNHGYPSNYMPVGLDATVNWGSPDLKIRNNGNFPIKIMAESTEDYVYVWILGTETRDYTVRMGFASSGDGYAKSYTVKYDNATGAQISKEFCALSGYIDVGTPVIGEIGSDEAYIYGNVRQQETRTPSEEALSESRNYRQPNTRG